MHIFSDMLRGFLKDRSMTVSELSRISGIERSFLQKIVTGTRMPSDTPAARRIAASLMLTPNETEQLISCYEITKVGEEAYYSRREISDMLKIIDDITVKAITGNETIVGNTDDIFNELGDIAPLTGKPNISRTVKAILEAQASANSGYVNIIAQPENNFLIDQLLNIYSNKPNISITQVIALHGTTRQGGFNTYNLKCLRMVMPYLFSSCSYSLRCYYDLSDISAFKEIILPYIIVTERHVVNLSADMRTAIFSSRPDLVRFFKDIFEDVRRGTESFVHKGEFISSREPQAGIRGFYFDIEYVLQNHLHLGMAFTRDILELVAPENMPNREHVLETIDGFINNRREHLRSSPRGYITSFCTTAGINEFISSGRTTELPTEFCHRLSVPLRIRIIEQLIETIESGLERLHIITSDTCLLNIPKSVNIIYDKEMGIVFSSLASHPSDRRFSLTERVTVNSFIDYLQCIPEEDGVMSCEKSVEYLKSRLFILYEMDIRDKYLAADGGSTA